MTPAATQVRRPATAPDGPTGTLATWLARAGQQHIPGPVVERAAHLVLDGLGCALIGARCPGRALRCDARARDGRRGHGSADRLGPHHQRAGRRRLNGTFIQGFELDDYFPAAPLHSTSLVLPALLSTLAMLGCRVRAGVPAR